MTTPPPGPCRQCGEPAHYQVVALTDRGPRVGFYRAAQACDRHLTAVRTWASAAGRPLVTRLGPAPAAQGDLFAPEAV